MSVGIYVHFYCYSRVAKLKGSLPTVPCGTAIHKKGVLSEGNAHKLGICLFSYFMLIGR